MKPKLKANNPRRSTGVLLHPVVRAWVARDTTKINIGRRPYEPTLLFTRKPKLQDSGFWYAYGHDGDGGRWPIPNSLRLKPGQCVEVTISPNDQALRPAK